MLFYLIVTCITSGLAYLYTKVKKTQKNIIFMLLVLFPSIVSGLRGVGTDYIGYNSGFFEIITGMNEYIDYGSAYVALLRLLGTVGFDFQFLTFITSLIFIYITFYVYRVYESSINFNLAVFSFMVCFYQTSFNIFRQMLAVSIFILGVVELCKYNDKRRFWSAYVIASLVHNITIPFGILYFFRDRIFDKKYIRFRVGLYVGIGAFIFLIPQLTNSLDSLLRFIPRYGWYITRFYSKSIGFGIIRYLVVAVLPAGLIYKGDRYLEIKEKGMEFLPFFSVMGFVLWLASYITEATLFRISYFLLFILPILHGYVFKKILATKKVAYIVLVVSVLLIFWYYDGEILNSGGTVPYHFYWEIN